MQRFFSVDSHLNHKHTTILFRLRTAAAMPERQGQEGVQQH